MSDIISSITGARVGIDFSQPGGFPLETETLKKMQDAYRIFNQYGHVMGDKTIISGGIKENGEITPGYLFVNDELVWFKGGAASFTHVEIRDIVEDANFEGDTVPTPTYFTKEAHLTSGGANAIPWTEFTKLNTMVKMMKDLQTLNDKTEELERKANVFNGGGTYVLWNKPDTPEYPLPEGWVEATEMKGLMPIGLYRDYQSDPLGRAKDRLDHKLNEMQHVAVAREHKLHTNEMPSHNHGGTALSAGNHRHKLFSDRTGENADNITTGWADSGGSDENVAFNKNYTTEDGNHTHSLSINPTGGGLAHNNMPPHRVIMFIKYVGV